MATSAKTIFKAVSKLGLSRAQARRLLPSWWSEEMESGSSGSVELGLHLSRRLSIDLEALAGGNILPKGAVEKIAYKHNVLQDTGKLTAASFIASSVAQSILAACRQPYVPLPTEPTAVQQMIRKASPGRPLGFDGLLALCWSHGIPVIPLPNLPSGVRKMDGAALRVGDRPVIVIAKKRSSRAWLSFILAHEVGHVALQHLEADSSIVDVSLKEESTYAAESSADHMEAEADSFALSIMGGAAVLEVIGEWSSRLSPVEMAVAAREAGQKLGVEAGHLVLRYAFEHRRWAESTIALRFLSEDWDPDPVLVEGIRSAVDLELVADDLQEWIAAITGMAQS